MKRSFHITRGWFCQVPAQSSPSPSDAALGAPVPRYRFDRPLHQNRSIRHICHRGLSHIKVKRQKYPKSTSCNVPCRMVESAVKYIKVCAGWCGEDTREEADVGGREDPRLATTHNKCRVYTVSPSMVKLGGVILAQYVHKIVEGALARTAFPALTKTRVFKQAPPPSQLIPYVVQPER